MFVDEIREKLNIGKKKLPFVLTLAGDDNIIINGVKNVVLTTSNEIKVKVKNGEITIKGESLNIVESGGGDTFVKGEIQSVEVKKN